MGDRRALRAQVMPRKVRRERLERLHEMTRPERVNVAANCHGRAGCRLSSRSATGLRQT